MIRRSLRELSLLSGGELNDSSYEDKSIVGVSSDTRTLRPGCIFMPLIGANLDGHQFINEAIRKGAVASFWQRDHEYQPLDLPLIYVDDSKKAFQNLAKNYRAQLKTKIIGVTGSNGKTTTKDIVSAVLSTKYKVKKTIGNLNNDIGVPRTLLELDDDTEYAVIEMGTEGFGEIHLLSEIARPNIAIFTNVGDAHLEQLKTRENIAKAKYEILDGLDRNGTFIYNGDNKYIKDALLEHREGLPKKVISFGKNEGNDYRLKEVSRDITGSIFEINGDRYEIPLLGSQQMYNAACAIIIGEQLGFDHDQIQEGLMETDMTSSRSELISCEGFDILNDAYNSNPQSLGQALETMNFLTGYKRKIAIIGDMLSLGKDEIEMHREIGRKIDPNKIDYLLLIGDLSKYIGLEAEKNFPDQKVFHFDRKEDLIDKAKYLIAPSTLVLVKASRALRLEEVIEGIREISAY